MAFYKKLQQLGCLFIALGALTANAAPQTLITQNDFFYTRAIQLSHNADSSKNGAIIVSGTAFDGGAHGGIFISTDKGQSFSPRGRADDPDLKKGLCCGGLYELPVKVGNLPAGTLLWSASAGQDIASEPMQLKIYQSQDQGANWSYLSNCTTANKPKSQGGLWEAEFAIAANGELVCYYSDETQLNHSQVLRLTHTKDGVNWSDPVDVVSSASSGDRPGMANVVRLPSGSYVMSYEICGPLNCAVHMRTSADGLDWGNPQNLGTPVKTPDGLTFWGTPTLIWAPLAGSEKGQLILQGHTLVKNTSDQPGNGATLFINSSGDPAGTWAAYDSPTNIALPAGTGGNYCQNYSNAMLALDGGTQLLELASDFVNGQSCKTYFRVAPLGGVRAAISNVLVSKGSSASTDINLHTSANYAGSYTLSVTAKDAPADFVLSETTVNLSANSDKTIQLKVTPTAIAAINKAVTDPLYASTFGLPLLALLFMRGINRKKRNHWLLALLALPLVLIGCGGGGGGGSSSSGSTPSVTVSTTYNATLTATNVADPSVTTSIPFKITISKTN